MVALEALGKGVDLVVANIYALMVGFISVTISWVLFAFQTGVKSPGGPFLYAAIPIVLAPLLAAQFAKQLGLPWYGLTVAIYTLIISIHDAFLAASTFRYLHGPVAEFPMLLVMNFALGLIIYLFGYLGVMALMAVWGRLV